MKKIIAGTLLVSVCLFSLCSCSNEKIITGSNSLSSQYSQSENSQQNADTNTNSTSDSTSSQSSAQTDFSKTDKEMFTSRDTKSEETQKDSITITLKGNTASANDSSVKISGSTVTITKNATHIITGTLNDGMIIVNAPDDAKLSLILNGANIKSKTSAALYVKSADKVFLSLSKGTKNSLQNGGQFKAIDDSNIDAALFSKQDLTLKGEGSLTVTSPAGHGIVCKDDLVVTSGDYTITSASHAIDANDSVRISAASLNLDAGKDGIHCENSDDTSLGFVYVSSGNIKIESEGDGISAGAYMQIENGTINVTAGGGSENGSNKSSGSFGGFMGGRPGEFENSSETDDESATSMKGLKAENAMLIKGGKITVNSADDSLHSNSSLTISGGEFKIASGDDAIHAEETLTVTAGKIDISESYEGLEALHIKVQGGNIKLSASDDGLNAAGGVDQSGTSGGRDGMFGGSVGGRPGRPGGMGGGMSSSSNGSIAISGGTLYVKASGDGIDANGTLEISGGHTTVVGPTQGDTATLDYDKSAVISGGTFIGTGAAGMAQTFSSSEQGVISLRSGNMSEGTKITLKSSNDITLISLQPELPFAVVILSSPDIVKGKTYTVTIGSQSSQIEAN